MPIHDYAKRLELTKTISFLVSLRLTARLYRRATAIDPIAWDYAPTTAGAPFPKIHAKKSVKPQRVLPISGRDGRIRTYACNSQSVVSYRLTTSPYKRKGPISWSQSSNCGVDDRGRTDDLQGHNLAL